MTTVPDQFMIDTALQAAAQSPCRSKRGVVLFDMRTGAFRGAGFNSPPQGCPGHAVCAGTCGRRSVHAEVRALRAAESWSSAAGRACWRPRRWASDRHIGEARTVFDLYMRITNDGRDADWIAVVGAVLRGGPEVRRAVVDFAKEALT